jgi:predicted Zn-dependent protease
MISHLTSSASSWRMCGAIGMLALAACATNPATGKKELSLMSEAQQIQIGREMDAQVRREMGVYEDAALQQYVERTGLRLARVSERPNLPWHFTVVDVPAVNAFALPGGYIYITRGILPFLNDEAQLAGVLGHEIGHVTARHAAQQYTSATSAGLGLTLLSIFVPEARPLQGVAEQALGVLFLKYGRDDELQADRLGVEYTTAANWNPGGIAGMLTTLQRLDEASGSRKGVPNWLSTHPAPEDRVARIQPVIEQARASLKGEPITTDRAEYLRRIDGIVYGDSPSQGIVRGNEFLHPELRLAVTFPAGWDVQNTPTQVAAKAPGRDDYVLLQQVQNPRGSIAQIARSTMENAGFQQTGGEPTRLNGADAYVGTYQGTVQGLGRIVVVAAHIVHDRNVYVLAGLAPRDDIQQVHDEFESTIRSFRGLSASQAAQIKPNRLDLYTVRSGDNWESIAQRAGDGLIKPATLAIMNSYQPNQPPRAGEQIKVVSTS